VEERALEHARLVMQAMLVDGQVVPLLGAGVNVCGRLAPNEGPVPKLLPTGSELAALLARKVPGYPPSVLEDLLRVSQCVDQKRGWKVLYMTLHELFDNDYEPTELHRFLANLPNMIDSLKHPPRETHLLFVTTNYDDVLERALHDAGEPYDLIWYVARGDNMGRFMHRTSGADGATVAIIDPDRYIAALDLAERSIVLKIHGAVDRPSGDNDSYVITEDNYIEYLTRTDIRKLIPKGIVAKLHTSNILFLGYSMRDWNLRAIFHRIWQEEKLGWKSWAIRRPLDPLPDHLTVDATAKLMLRQLELEHELEEAFWDDRGVDIFDVDLTAYTHALEYAARELIAEDAP
jgi:hypothetical protein